MNLISLKFALLFFVLFIIYWMIPSRFLKLKSIYLIITSYFIYALWNATYVIILLFVTIVSYIGSLYISNQINRERRKLATIVSIIFTMFPLFTFKYVNLICTELRKCSIISNNTDSIITKLIVPIGISFYTLQAAGYIFDVYRKKCDVEHNIIYYCLFICFFPQLSSGPISTSSNLMPQIKSERVFEYSKAISGLRSVLFGVFLKTVIADRAGIYVDTVYSNITSFSGINCLIASIVYSIEIYSDFYGYSLLAIGMSNLFGFELVENFKTPYFSESITEFWKRWHISLSTWLKNNIYIPLGGNKCSKPRTYINIIVTFIISGLWHGANLTYLLWGIFHGIILIFEKVFCLDVKKTNNKTKKCLRIILTFVIINFTWIIFRSPNIDTAIIFIKQILTLYKGFDIKTTGFDTLVYFAIGTVLLFAYETLKEFYVNKYNKICSNKLFRYIVYIGMAILILTIGVLDGGNFIYVSF